MTLLYVAWIAIWQAVFDPRLSCPGPGSSHERQSNGKHHLGGGL